MIKVFHFVHSVKWIVATNVVCTAIRLHYEICHSMSVLGFLRFHCFFLLKIHTHADIPPLPQGKSSWLVVVFKPPRGKVLRSHSSHTQVSSTPDYSFLAQVDGMVWCPCAAGCPSLVIAAVYQNRWDRVAAIISNVTLKHACSKITLLNCGHFWPEALGNLGTIHKQRGAKTGGCQATLHEANWGDLGMNLPISWVKLQHQQGILNKISLTPTTKPHIALSVCQKQLRQSVLLYSQLFCHCIYVFLCLYVFSTFSP